MDEPSTGLDPASRHRLWEVISMSKGKNSILLTTHSMEEADVLCERIGIMGAGDMLCVGTSLDLKSRFGAGYRLSLHLSDKGAAAAGAAAAVVTELMPSARLLNEPLGGVLDFEVKGQPTCQSTRRCRTLQDVQRARSDRDITLKGNHFAVVTALATPFARSYPGAAPFYFFFFFFFSVLHLISRHKT